MRIVTSNQFHIVATLMVIAILGVCLWVAPPKFVSDRPRLDDPTVIVQQRLTQLCVARAEFLAHYDDIVNQLAWRGLSLMDGVECLVNYCQLKYPIYLSGLEYLGKGRNLREKLAWNILLHVKSEAAMGNGPAWPAGFMERLEQQFQLLMCWKHPCLL